MTGHIYGLTSGQADCARVIAAMTDFLGNSPSNREIAAELGITLQAVYPPTKGPTERGWLVPRAPWAHRALRLTRSPPPFDGRAVAITEAGRLYLEKHAA